MFYFKGEGGVSLIILDNLFKKLEIWVVIFYGLFLFIKYFVGWIKYICGLSIICIGL